MIKYMCVRRIILIEIGCFVLIMKFVIYFVLFIGNVVFLVLCMIDWFKSRFLSLFFLLEVGVGVYVVLWE